MKSINSVDNYIANAPDNVQGVLSQLREIIKHAAPDAIEKISYGMPYFGYKGRLAYFRLSKTHIGLYIPPPVIANHIQELSSYDTSTATIRFPIDKKLPVALIEKLVKARVKINDDAKQ